MFLEHVLLTTGLNLNGRIHSSIFYIAYPLQGCGWTGAYFSWLLARGGADPEMVVCQYNRLILCVIIFFAPMKHMTITDHLTNLHSSIFLKDVKKRKPKAHTKKYRVVFRNYYLWILSRSAYFYPRLGSLFCRSKLGWWLDLGRVKMVTTTRFFWGGLCDQMSAKCISGKHCGLSEIVIQIPVNANGNILGVHSLHHMLIPSHCRSQAWIKN